MTRDQALAKIKKCLALGKSTNPHEAAAAIVSGVEDFAIVPFGVDVEAV